ncbi:diaminopimelate epimerase [Cohnella boryungensis]|uniref:Diaminopimelate epimerase n=1 Tax=Cohnella boryungensis TaxID=768479 RepID=A0ABV8SIY4_9BACL
MGKHEIEFVKLNPTQNMTLLVTTKHSPEDQPRIAARMMAYDHVHGEQVGFIEEPLNGEAAAKLQMAGGEFCGNACMALAAYLAAERGLRHEDATDIVLEASGSDRFVVCQVRRSHEAYVCRVDMPIPRQIEQRAVRYEGEELLLAIVRYRDFLHVVLEVDQVDKSVRRKAKQLARLLGVALGTSLIGILLFKPDSHELAPLIYVPSLDSMVWERGCGSGTASLGAYLAWKNKGAVAVPVKQPGGTIQVTADCERDKVTRLLIEGTVGIVAQGKAYIEA